MPFLVFAASAVVTYLVWRGQVQHQRSQLARHTEDVCVQAARHLAARLELRLSAATVFARRWATHETRDFSRQRFFEFAQVVLKELPEYQALRLVPAAGGAEWVAPSEERSAWHGWAGASGLLAQARGGSQPVLSPPLALPAGERAIFAAIALRRGAEFLGHLVAEFRSAPLIAAVFHQRVREEFNILVADGEAPVLRLAESDAFRFEDHPVRSAVSLAARQRSWTLTMVPRSERASLASWGASLAIPAVGLSMSFGLAALVFLLSRRMELYRGARDRALKEIEERTRAQQALQATEARYHSVFDSATDGLVVLDDAETIVEANAAASAMHGCRPEEFIGRPYHEFVPPQYHHLREELHRQLREFGSARLDSVHQRKDGSTVDVEVRGTSFSYGGEPRILAILTDVSERKLAVQRHTQLSRKVLIAQEEERARLSRELHDELGQILTALHLEIDWLHKKAGGERSTDNGVFDNAVQMVEKAADELRAICRGLRPPLLDDLGLEPAVRLLVEEFEDRLRIKTDLQVQLSEAEHGIPPEVGLCTYRILQESLHNVGRHARAKEVTITLREEGRELMLSVYDDGQGFNVQEMKRAKGVGISGMRERASLVNGMIDIRSEPLQGTRVIFRAPLDATR